MAAILLEHDDHEYRSLVSSRTTTLYEKNGRRRVRRRDNSRFIGNEHIVEPSLNDYGPVISLPRTTFSIPVPPFISRANPPISAIPCSDPITANAGRYSLSLKGIRKRLRKAGPKAEQVVSEIDDALTAWLHTGAAVIQPDVPLVESLDGLHVDSSRFIQEISRSVLQLIWRVDDDFYRFLLHCVARFYGILSYSKSVSAAGRDVRVTYLLRPNVIRPDFGAASRLDTPPATDIEGLSTPADTENESDALSDTSDEINRGENMDIDGLPTVLEENSDEEETFLKPNEKSSATVLPMISELRGDDWLEDEGRRGNHRTGATSIDFEFRRNHRNVPTIQQNSRSASSPSRSPEKLYRRRIALRPFLPDKQMKFWHYVYG